MKILMKLYKQILNPIYMRKHIQKILLPESNAHLSNKIIYENILGAHYTQVKKKNVGLKI